MRNPLASILFPVLFLVPIAEGCMSVPAGTTALADVGWTDPNASPAELRLRMFEFYSRFSAEIENAADEIMAASEDPVVKRAALEWKIDAISEVQRAAFRSDPLGALLDSWFYCAQMEAYLTDGDGSDMFGPEQHIARAVAARLHRQITEIGATVARDGDLSPILPEVEHAVEAYPIEASLSLRRTPIEEYAHLASGATSISGIAADMNQQVGDLSRRVTFYAAQLPRQARWEAELLVDDHLDTLATSVDRIAGVLEHVPEMVETERTAITEAISAELGVVLDSVNEQRLEVLGELTRERMEVIEALREERKEIVGVLSAERVEVVDVLREERRLAVVDAEAAGGRLLNASVPPAVEVIDHLFVRLLQVLGGVLILGIVLGLIGLRVYRSASPRTAAATTTRPPPEG